MMKTWLGLGMWLLPVVLAGTACSTKTETAPFGDKGSFCQAKAKEECQKAPALCPVQESSCLTEREAACQAFAGQVSTGGRTYVGGNAQACIDKTHEAYSKDPVTVADMDAMNDACNRVFKGATKEFEKCGSTYECDGDLICDKELCAKRVVKSSGQPCGNPGEVCDTTSYCAANAANVRVCQPLKQEGETCNDTTPCKSELRCNLTCQPRFAAGAPCDSNADCGSTAPYCDKDQGNRCDGGLRFGAGTTCNAYGG